MKESIHSGKILLICPESDLELGLFNDIACSETISVRYVTICRRLYIWIKKSIYTFNYLLNLKFKLPRWLFCCDIKNWHKGFSRIIIRSNVLEYIDIYQIQRLKKRGIRCDLFLIDSIDGDSKTIVSTKRLIRSELWDNILTFDRQDAEKYGFSFAGFHYYSKPNIPLPGKILYDVYYVGSFKGNRTRPINDTFKVLTANGICCHYDVLSDSLRKTEEAASGINVFRKSLPYSEILRQTAACTCILEIIQENQHGPSLRYFEAVVFNKKLLTNNPYVVDFPYYKPEYIKVFKDAGDIDINWLKADIAVDYHYNGDFSPLKLFEEG